MQLDQLDQLAVTSYGLHGPNDGDEEKMEPDMFCSNDRTQLLSTPEQPKKIDEGQEDQTQLKNCCKNCHRIRIVLQTFNDTELEEEFLSSQYQTKTYFTVLFTIVAIAFLPALFTVIFLGYYFWVTVTYGAFFILGVISRVPYLRRRWTLVASVIASLQLVGLTIMAYLYNAVQYQVMVPECGARKLGVNTAICSQTRVSVWFDAMKFFSKFMFQSASLLYHEDTSCVAIVNANHTSNGALQVEPTCGEVKDLARFFFSYGVSTAVNSTVWMYMWPVALFLYQLPFRAYFPLAGAGLVVWWVTPIASQNLDLERNHAKATIDIALDLVTLFEYAILTYAAWGWEKNLRGNFVALRSWGILKQQLLQERLSAESRALLEDSSLVSPETLMLLRMEAEEDTMTKAGLQMLKDLSAKDILLQDRDVTLGKRIGCGAFGSVYAGRLGKNTDVALKEAATKYHVTDLAHEAAMLLKIEHPSIVRMFGIWQGLDPVEQSMKLFMVMELCSGGDLNEAILLSAKCRAQVESSEDASQPRSVEDADNQLPLSQKLRWLGQISAALGYLHSRIPPIVHRDIKPQNVLLMSDTHRSAKLADFGTSRAQSAGEMTTGIGTYAYTPPEVMAEDITELDGTKWDAYSFAITAATLLTEREPYSGLRNYDIFIQVGQKGCRPDLKTDIHDFPPGLTELVQAAWAADPQARPSMSSAAQYFSEVIS